MRLGEALGFFVKSYISPELVRGTVKAVDKQKKTCVVTPADGGADYVGVKLTAAEGENKEAVVMLPKVGSWVYIGKLENNASDTFVLKMTEVDEIIFHDGKNGGLCITPELVAQLSRLSGRVDRLENAIKNGTPATGAPDAGSALIASMKVIVEMPLQKEDFSKIENKRIKH